MTKNLHTASARPEGTDAVGSFECRVNPGRFSAWIHVVGELDLVTAPELAVALEQAGGCAWLIALDMREVTFVDSSGLSVIAAAAQHALQVGQRIAVVADPDSQVHRMLKLTGVADRLEIVDDALNPIDSPTGPQADTTAIIPESAPEKLSPLPSLSAGESESSTDDSSPFTVGPRVPARECI